MAWTVDEDDGHLLSNAEQRRFVKLVQDEFPLWQSHVTPGRYHESGYGVDEVEFFVQDCWWFEADGPIGASVRENWYHGLLKVCFSEINTVTATPVMPKGGSPRTHAFASFDEALALTRAMGRWLTERGTQDASEEK